MFCGAGISNGLAGTELGVSWLLPRAVGTSHSAEILLTGKKVGAEEALRIGTGLPGGGRRRGRSTRPSTMAEGMCAFSPFGLALTKDTLWASLEVGSLRAAVDLENRTQLLAGHTGNLTEATRGLQGEAAARLHRVVARMAEAAPSAQTRARSAGDLPGDQPASTGGPTGTAKTRFADEDEANRSSLRLRLETGADLDPYRCSFCGGWHLGGRRE